MPSVRRLNRYTLKRFVAILAASLVLCACRTVGYMAHVAQGQAGLVVHQRDIASVVADPATDPALAARLELSRQARQFASDHLLLPANRSYTRYVDLHRPYVVWNVFATPRYSVDPVTACFPVAGCVPYQGFFEEAKARSEAKRLEGKGNDVYVGGVAAYSTLGWFSDPILSSMLRWDDDELAGTIFHELAHQLVYVKGDTAFNESFASFVQEEGLRQWRSQRGLPPPDSHDQAADDAFSRQVLDLRERLRKVYARGGDALELEAAKQAEIAGFRDRYRAWSASDVSGNHRFDAWVAAPINNAKLLPFGLYDGWKPAFASLFASGHGDWKAFYAGVRALAALSPAEREIKLKALMPSSS